jgi:Tfp pilus assembly protein PilN
MIRVNLLRDRSRSRSGAPVAGSEFGDFQGEGSGTDTKAFNDMFGGIDFDEKKSGGGGASSQLESVFKILIVIALPLALYFYEKYQNDNNQRAITTKQQEVRELESLLASKNKVIEDLEPLKKRFENERKFIEDVRGKLINRMHFVRGLDSIQSSVVPNLWLTSIEYDNGNFKIDGQALYKNDLDTFYNNLNKIPFFNKAIIVKDSEVRNRREGAFEFSIVTEAKTSALGGV